ncbi:DNA polymerase IV [Donghicola tyrosinivorans]|uniref:DNA polymerase IV n=1 Tax=Donghicola tyrosinivorans TaxID=1652492 RepID=A0A2T0WYS5_9RHOB|nr:DNA polymerase IV [Donghicola tyrosinivorans]PRY91849.1 DNA polymerase-4 [Donghicola tyrosinivorans]
MPALCRDCLSELEHGPRCGACGSPRVVAHEELWDLSIAHMDCDAFYASVEKRDRPELAAKPVVIGGGRRGVVSTACYVARIRGVRSAMPMFKALELCPDAVVIKPRMDVYAAVSKEIRLRMEALTPAVEPLSLDEAFVDLTGTARLHGAPPAVLMARLVRDMKRDLGITGSVGLSHNKFLAKIASDLNKPHGFSVIGKAETQAFLARQKVGIIWGVGTATQAALERAGIRDISDLLRWEREDLIARFGSMGERLYHLARGEDRRKVSADRGVKSVSNETTFDEDISDADLLDGYLWRMSEKVADRLKAKDIAGRTVGLKMKRSDFRSISRQAALGDATQMADRIYRTARGLLDQVQGDGPFRLLGVGVSDLVSSADADRSGDLLDPQAGTRAKAERATDEIRKRFGADAILKGRALR